MKKFIWIFLIHFAVVSICLAQDSGSQVPDRKTANIILIAGSKISGKLQDALDVEKTKNSDDFVLILSEEIKGGGVVIAKGTELLGRVVRVKTISAEDNTSEISLFFDFVKLEDDYLVFKALVTSVTSEKSESENASDKKNSLFSVELSPSFKGASVISTKGKNLVVDAGLVFQLKLVQDLVKR